MRLDRIDMFLDTLSNERKYRAILKEAKTYYYYSTYDRIKEFILPEPFIILGGWWEFRNDGFYITELGSLVYSDLLEIKVNTYALMFYFDMFISGTILYDLKDRLAVKRFFTNERNAHLNPDLA